jgi:hypothetical protein
MALLPMLTPILAHLEAARLTQLLEAQPSPGAIAAGPRVMRRVPALARLDNGRSPSIVGGAQLTSAVI